MTRWQLTDCCNPFPTEGLLIQADNAKKQKIEDQKLSQNNTIKRIFSRTSKLPKISLRSITSILISEARAFKIRKYISEVSMKDISNLTEKKIITI